MKYNININQKAYIESGLKLTLEQLILIDFFSVIPTLKGAIKIHTSGKDYFLLSYKFIIDQLPLLDLSKQSIYRQMKGLEASGLLESHPDNQTLGGAYYALTDLVGQFHFSLPYIKNDIPPLSKMIDHNSIIDNKEEEGDSKVVELIRIKEVKREEVEAYIFQPSKYLKLSSKIERFKGLTAPSNQDLTREVLFEGYWNAKGHKETHKGAEFHYNGFDWYLNAQIDFAFKRETDFKSGKTSYNGRQTVQPPKDAPWRKDWAKGFNETKDDGSGRWSEHE